MSRLVQEQLLVPNLNYSTLHRGNIGSYFLHHFLHCLGFHVQVGAGTAAGPQPELLHPAVRVPRGNIDSCFLHHFLHCLGFHVQVGAGTAAGH